MKISSQEFHKFVQWFFTLNFSLTRENLLRLFAQTTSLFTLIATGGLFYKCMASRSCSLNFIPSSVKNYAANIFTSREKSVERKIKSIELYGADEDTLEALSEKDPQLTPLLADAVSAYIKKEGDYDKKAKAFCEELQAKFSYYLFVHLSPITYPDGSTYFVVDVVELKDESARLTFTSPSSRIAHNGPNSLLSNFDEYLKLGTKLSNEGKIKSSEQKVPEIWYTCFGHSHLALKPFQQIFVDSVENNLEALVEVFMEDTDDTKAAKIVFLLGYRKSGEDLMKVLTRRIRDENWEIRNNILKVFAFMAKHYPEIQLPLYYGIIPALNDPLATNRNEAAAILYHHLPNLVKQGKISNEVLPFEIKQAIPFLLKMEKLKQPKGHEYAKEILNFLEKQQYGFTVKNRNKE
ncbi:MAG: HEAT repeat domain-containing protein [Chlamydiae bacterium]|nr:HEAT repeat domain-containing protein [Chlamydiota bacterium]